MFFYFETAMHKATRSNKCISHNHLKLALLDNDNVCGSIPMYVIILAKETINA